jgi:predicted lipoprotein with Yx(FWY)xxD motif
MRFTRVLTAAALVLAAVVLTAGAVAATQAGGSVVKVGSSSLGRILVDGHGKTLYVWAHDKGAKSTCYGQCASYWPPLTTSGKPRAIGGARAALLSTSRRSDGRMQVTYHGHPLYYFAGDKRAGQTAGEGLTGFGGRWDPISAAGTLVQKHMDSSGSGYPGWSSYTNTPLKAVVITPGRGDVAGVGGAFNVDVSLQARNARANALLSAAAGYKPFFNDPSAPTFHPGPNIGAPGLVVTLSTTPRIAGTPLVGPRTNLAGVFQLNAVTNVNGLNRTFNAWQVSSPGFFGINKSATLTVYAVRGTAPAAVPASGLNPISNVVRIPFTIGA